MDWLNWLDKEEPIPAKPAIPAKPIKIKKKPKLTEAMMEKLMNDKIERDKTKPDKTISQITSDFDDETHEDPFSNKAWEQWLEKGRWDSDEAKEKEKKSREARATIDALKEWASQPEKSEKQQAKEHYNQTRAYNDEQHSAQQLPKKTRVPRSRVAGHTTRPVSRGDELYGNFSPEDTKEGWNSPTYDKYRKTTGRSDHALHSKYKIPKKLSGKFDKDFETHTGKKPKNNREVENAMQSISTTEAELGKSWESWLEKNNAIETSHKEDEKKEEWDGKFSSSTTRDDAEDDDKAISEEESLEELTDGKLEEVEKLKSWQVFLVNKMPMNQYDKSPQKVGDEKGMKSEPLTETTPVSNPRGSLGNKKVKRLDHEAGDGSRKIVEIPKEDNTNPEVLHKQGGRPETGGKGSQGSVNATAGGKGNVTQTNTNAILYQSLSDTEKEKEPENITDDVSTISNNDSDPATPAVAETAMQKRQRLVRLTQRKYNKKSWESWLNKYEETVEDKRLAIKLDEARAITSGKVSKPKIKPDSGVDAKMGEFSNIQAEKLRSATVSPLDSWATWLEKMQGAGDARFGNQHLTGLDQEPVDNEEDEANILPAKDENQEENDEKQEETNGKPYKALDEK